MAKKISKMQVKIIKADSVKIKGREYDPKKKNILCLLYQEFDRETIKRFYLDHIKGKNVDHLELELTIPTKRRSNEQNRLYWALLRILSFALKGCHGYEEELHEELLRMYAPRIPSLLGDEDVPKRSKDMDTEEFSFLITSVFKHLAEAGTFVESPQDIRQYWRQYYEWRGIQKTDPLKIKTIEEYRDMVPYCEACLKYTRVIDEFGTEQDTGHMSHIVSKGSGGEMIPENFLHLCSEHHIGDQHQHGWEEFLEEFPHLRWKVEQARQIASRRPVQIEAEISEPDEDLELF